jgi:hypothetical protein
VRRCPVEKRAACFLFATEDLDEPAVHQHLERRARIHTAHLVDLRTRDRLPIGEDRERLDLRTREAHGLARDELTHEGRVLDRGAELISACDLDELNAARAVFADEHIEQALHFLRRRMGNLRKAIRRHRLVGDEEQALQDRLEMPLARRKRRRLLQARTNRLNLVLVFVLIERMHLRRERADVRFEKLAHVLGGDAFEFGRRFLLRTSTTPLRRLSHRLGLGLGLRLSHRLGLRLGPRLRLRL